MRSVFITGTDTGIGKTRVSTALLRALREAGIDAVGMKPVASGCERIDGAWRNDDALALIDAGPAGIAYDDVNPWALPAAIAPQAAAAEHGVEITLAPIQQAFEHLLAPGRCVVVEGAGGWLVPLSDTLMQPDIPRALHVPVILVVGLRLGCINHALLSARAIIDEGCELLGWIGNRIDPAMQALAATETTLRQRLGVPCLGMLDYARGIDAETRALAPAVECLRR